MSRNMYYEWYRGLQKQIENLEKEIATLKNTTVVEKVEISTNSTRVTYNVLKNIGTCGRADK